MDLRIAIALSVVVAWACGADVKGKTAPDWRQVPVSIELRLAEGAAGSGLTPWAVYGQSRTVYLHPDALISNGDITGVEAVQTRIGRGLILEISLSKAGAARIHQITGRHIGDSLAVLIDSVVVSVPVIRQAIGGNPKLPFDLGVPLQPKEAQQLAAAIAKTWPPAQRRAAGRR